MASEEQNHHSVLNAILQASNEAIFTKSLSGIITSWSHGASRVYGYASSEIVGRPVADLMPPERKHEARDLTVAVRAGRSIESFKTQRLSKSGELLDLLLTVTPIVNESGSVTGALTIAHNLSRQHSVEDYLQLLSERERSHLLVLNAAQRVALDVLSSQTGIEALRHIADAARTLTGAQYAALGVARQNGEGGLQEFITVGLTPEEEARIGPRPRGEGVLGVLLERTEPLRIDRLGSHDASVGFPPNHPPMDSFLGVPIRSQDRILGSLYLTNKTDGKGFTEEDEVAVSALGAHAAIAIHNLLMLSRQRGLVRGLIAAQEEERRAIAYDLHDGLTQFVMGSYAHMEAFKTAHAKGNEEKAERELDAGLKYLKEAVQESRRMVNGLRLLALDDLGLSGALEQVVEEERRRAGWTDADFVHNIAGQRFATEIETTVYRIAQEALNNVRKHASASRVRVTLLIDEKQADPNTQRFLQLEVRDWGRGFDMEAARRDDNRVGLQSMFTRVHNMNGKWSLQSAPGSGTSIRATLPVYPKSVESLGEIAG